MKDWKKNLIKNSTLTMKEMTEKAKKRKMGFRELAQLKAMGKIAPSLEKKEGEVFKRKKKKKISDDEDPK